MNLRFKPSENITTTNSDQLKGHFFEIIKKIWSNACSIFREKLRPPRQFCSFVPWVISCRVVILGDWGVHRAFPHSRIKGCMAIQQTSQKFLKTQKVVPYLNAEKKLFKPVRKWQKLHCNVKSTSKNWNAIFKSKIKPFRYADWF